MKVFGRYRTPEGQVMRVGLDAGSPGQGREPRRMTPPPEYLVQPAPDEGHAETERDPWWFLRAVTQEAYQKHF